ncbi:MAG: hypothetical protein U9R53_01540, partial [Chloroflexota bacterium]|nr:hypothetical protein [Chloroflexota bacterium]
WRGSSVVCLNFSKYGWLKTYWLKFDDVRMLLAHSPQPGWARSLLYRHPPSWMHFWMYKMLFNINQI